MDTRPARLNLLKAIRARAVLWKQSHTPVNRADVVKAWEEVAEELDGRFSVAAIKCQWRYMRNVYRNCERKQISRNEKPNWVFFDKMNFLSKDFDGKLDDIDDWSDLEDDGSDVDKNDYDDVDTSIPKGDSDFDDEDDKPLTKVDSTTKDKPVTPVRQRKKLSTKKVLKVTLERISPITQTRKAPQKTNYNNSDHQFLMSLVPYLSAIPTSRKLLVRSKIQKVLEEEQNR